MRRDMATTFHVLDWHLNTTSYSEPDAMAHLGRVPLLLDPNCADPVWLQIQTNYPEGWCPVLDREKWTLTADDYLIHVGLPPVAPAAMAWLRSERILVYPAGWIVVTELGKTEFTVARILP